MKTKIKKSKSCAKNAQLGKVSNSSKNVKSVKPTVKELTEFLIWLQETSY